MARVGGGELRWLTNTVSYIIYGVSVEVEAGRGPLNTLGWNPECILPLGGGGYRIYSSRYHVPIALNHTLDASTMAFV